MATYAGRIPPLSSSRACVRDDSADPGERSRAVLIRGRERVRALLEPHLGPAHALERANNIAQALALADAQPEAVAFEMLRQLPADDRERMAAAVRRAWLAAEHDERCARMQPSRARLTYR
jgi:hypothetical protein